MSTATPPINEAPGARAYRQLRRWIDDGVLKTGDYLLPEQELSEKLGVARTTIRSTLAKLENEGLVRLSGRKRTVLGSRRYNGTMRHTVGLLAAHPTASIINRLPGWSENIQIGAVGALQASGSFVLYLPPDEFFESRFNQFLSDHPRGIIGFPQDVAGCPPFVLAALHRSRVPSVFYGSHADPQLRPFHVVTSDHAHGQNLLTKLLIEKGRNRILRCWQGVPGEPLPDWLRQRDVGTLQALTEMNKEELSSVMIPHSHREIACESDFCHEARTYAGYLAEYVLRSEPVDAIMTVSDGMVPYVAAALRLLGREPGKDVAITGYDHYWADIRERRWEPFAPLATIDKRNAAIGVELVRILEGLIDGSAPAVPAEHCLDPALIVL
jgi:DNA-binding LacI/PurR family transcriptional regulator